MKNPKLPILRTHVANIALNKNIALPFLLSNAQSTHGLTEYSEESYTNDKLSIAIWMIQQFAELDEKDVKTPWVKLPEWEVATGSMGAIGTMHEFDETIEGIRKEGKSFTNLWDATNTKAVCFLKKIVAQAYECIWYTTQRLIAIQVLYQLGPMGRNDPDAMMSAGLEMAEKLSGNPMVMISGYLMVKNEMNSKRVLTSELLEIILEFLVDKAVQEGYAMPA